MFGAAGVSIQSIVQFDASKANAEIVVITHEVTQGQLDESPLTLAEITLLKEAFANSLASIHHQRIEYPTSKHLTKSPQKTAGTEPIKIKDEEQIELEDMSQE